MKSKILLKYSTALFVFECVILAFCILSRNFAEFYCRTLSSFVRFFISFITGLFAFSVAELVVLLLIPAIVGLIVVFIVLAVNKSTHLKNVLKICLSVVLLSVSVFINNFAVCYFRKPVEANMGFKRYNLTSDRLESSAAKVVEFLDDSLNGIDFAENGASINPHTWSETSNLIDSGFNRLSVEYPFISTIYAMPKRILLSPYMTYTHVSGIYFPFTGEANVNTNYPDYVVVFAMAHEKAHQRGIAGEDEANFIAALSLLASGDEYLVYASLVNVYEYYLDAMYVLDKDMYGRFVENTNSKVIGEFVSYSLFFEKYRESGIADFAQEINDTYIRSMGDSNGVKSYGKVVELFSSYMENRSGLPYWQTA